MIHKWKAQAQELGGEEVFVDGDELVLGGGEVWTLVLGGEELELGGEQLLLLVLGGAQLGLGGEEQLVLELAMAMVMFQLSTKPDGTRSLTYHFLRSQHYWALHLPHMDPPDH